MIGVKYTDPEFFEPDKEPTIFAGTLPDVADIVPHLQYLACKCLSGLELEVYPYTARRVPGGYVHVLTRCPYCGTEKWRDVRNLENKFIKKCKCRRKRLKKSVKRLIERYNSIIQRCCTDTHVSSHNYYGRGILCLFPDGPDFVRWALAAFPDVDFEKYDFDRIDNKGHYSKSNLRLAIRQANLRNSRTSENSWRTKADQFLLKNPSVSYSIATVINKLKSGLSDEEVLTDWKKWVAAGSVGKPSTNPPSRDSEVLFNVVYPKKTAFDAELTEDEARARLHNDKK